MRIGIELCNVLHYLHTHQPHIIFRDLKPSNVMVTPAGDMRCAGRWRLISFRPAHR